MKKTLLTALLAGLIAQFGFAQPTAKNFTSNDCAGLSHTLFTELDAGKVIVITWVMPCGSCISGAKTAANVVKGYASSNPGRVEFYLMDDYGTTSCSSIDSWATQNGITKSASFSNPSIKMTDYGAIGHPKTVVLGGDACHGIFYDASGAGSVIALQTAINNALTPCTGVIENNNIHIGLNVFPNPTVNNTEVSYIINNAADVSIDTFNVLGEKVNAIALGTQTPGKHEYKFNLESLNEGVYFLKLNAGDESQTVKFTVIH